MASPEHDTQLIRDLKEFTGLAPSRIAKEIGVAATTITRPYNGDHGTVLSRATVDKLRTRWPDFPGWPAEVTPEPNAIVQKFEGATLERMRQDLPILGTALGADRVVDDQAIEQTDLYTGEIIGFAKRPAVLDGRADAYGIYVQGSSMEPVHPDGSLILVDARRPPRVGDDVVVHLRMSGEADEADDGETSRTVLVKRLVRRSASHVELQQFTPPMTFTIAAKDILRTHRVLTMADLLS